MKLEQLSGLSALRGESARRWRRARTLLEALESRMLYSIVGAEGGAADVSPLLGRAAVPVTAPATLLSVAAPRQVEVATVRATGAVGPFVRIDMARFQALRAEAAVHREAMNEAAGERRSLWLSRGNDNGEVATGGTGGGEVVDSNAIESSPFGADRTERFAARITARAERVAAAWQRIQGTLDKPVNEAVAVTVDPSVEIDAAGPIRILPPIGEPIAVGDDAAADVPMGSDESGNVNVGEPELPPDWDSTIIAIIDAKDGKVYPLSPAWSEPVAHPGDSDVLGSIGGPGSVSDAIVNFSGSDGLGGSLTFRADGAGDGAAMTSGDVAMVTPGGETGAAADVQSSQAGAPTRGSGKSRPTVGVVAGGEEEDEARRAGRAYGGLIGSDRNGSARDHEKSIIAGNSDGVIASENGAGSTLVSAGARGLVTLAGITTAASLLGGGADGLTTSAAASAASIVVTPNGLAAIASAVDIGVGGLPSRAVKANDAAAAVVANGALLGAQRALELAREQVASAVGGIAAEVASADEAATTEAGGLGFDFTMGPSRSMILGLAPVWSWDGADEAGGSIFGSENLSRAWRYAAAGSLIVTLAGCWYCATAASRTRQIRRRALERSKFATTRRIQFNPRPA